MIFVWEYVALNLVQFLFLIFVLISVNILQMDKLINKASDEAKEQHVAKFVLNLIWKTLMLL